MLSVTFDQTMIWSPYSSLRQMVGPLLFDWKVITIHLGELH